MAGGENRPAKQRMTMTPKCPQGRLSAPTKLVKGSPVVDLNSYVPHLLSAVNNALSRGASQTYLEQFGIGIVEWRVISMLAIVPNIPASAICEEIHIDKGAASRALARLNAAGYVSFEAPKLDTRKKIWAISDKGKTLHDEVLATALARERDLIAGVDPEDLEGFIRAMLVMRDNVNRMK